MAIEAPWIVVGLLGQVVFSARFLVQLWSSEREGRSVVPVSFWYLSLLGTALLLAYALHRADPVFVLGQAFGAYVYIRNLVLIRRNEAPHPAGTG